MKTIFSSASIFFLILMFSLLSYISSLPLKNWKEKWSHFECGFNTLSFPQIPFSFQFFLVSLLFLIFDIEISLVLSFPLELKELKNLLNLVVFLLFLLFGLLYEWQKSKVDWSK